MCLWALGGAELPQGDDGFLRFGPVHVAESVGAAVDAGQDDEVLPAARRGRTAQQRRASSPTSSAAPPEQPRLAGTM